MWNERYRGETFAYGTEPNSFLVEHAGLFNGPVLRLAEGEGRNAVYLASLGLDVLGVDASDVGLGKPVFDSVIVVTDRVVLDRQLSGAVSSFEQTAGLVEHIDRGGRHLKEALESGKRIIITTLFKFPVVLEEVRKLEDEWKRQQRTSAASSSDASSSQQSQSAGQYPEAAVDAQPISEDGVWAFPSLQKEFVSSEPGSVAALRPTYRPGGSRFALILDEAHSSQGGEASKEMHGALRVHADDEDEMTPMELALRDQEARGRMQHVSTFAYTATPKERTLELFGRKTSSGSYEPFSLYSMRQAIEEGFIHDVLKNYISYRMFWTLLKKVKDDPKYDKQKASRLLTRFVAENPKTIREKVEVICEHLNSSVLPQISDKARAMLVTSSRQQAVTYKLEIDKYIAEMGFNWRTVVAFSGTVKDEVTGLEYTEAGLNGFPDTQTTAKFATDPYRLLIVANKYQTGFDQPLLQTMYVDKKLASVNAVQTLSRLNRVLPPHKTETCVIDFADNADAIKEAFSRYYGQTVLKTSTDPNDLYKIESQMKRVGFFFPADLAGFAKVFYKPRIKMEDVYAALSDVRLRVEAMTDRDQREIRSQLHRYTDLYAFLGQIISFTDPDLEQLYQFCRCLLPLLPVPKEEQPKELQRFVDVNTVRLVQAAKQKISPVPGGGELKPQDLTSGGAGGGEGQMEPLSEILKLLNDRFGTNFEPQDQSFLESLEQKLDEDTGMAASFAVNTRENARLTFDHKVRDHVQGMIDTNFKFFKQINDKPEFANFLNDLLFDRYAERKQMTDETTGGS